MRKDVHSIYSKWKADRFMVINITIYLMNVRRILTKPPYEVTETGWGEFEIVIKENIVIIKFLLLDFAVLN